MTQVLSEPLSGRPLAFVKRSSVTAAALAAAIALSVSSCAQKGFPPGGASDTTPPRVVSVSPDSGSIGVEVTVPISIAFSEKMDGRSVEAFFYLTPRTDMESLTWEGEVLTAHTARGLIEGATYTILLGAGIKDRRGNSTRMPVVTYFSTGDSIYPGVIKGEIKTGRSRAQSVMVWAYGSEKCPPDLADSPPDGVGQADSQGGFEIGGLDVTRSYCVYGHLDRDADGAFDEGDLFIGADSLVAFGPDSSRVSGVDIYLVPDDEPGAISGAVVDSAGPGAIEPDAALEIVAPDSTRSAAADSLALARARADSVYLTAKIIVTALDQADSSRFVQTDAGAKGVFELKGVRPGVYRVEVFRDLNGDKKFDAGEEPAAFREGMAVRPGRVCKTGVLVLKIEVPEVDGR